MKLLIKFPTKGRREKFFDVLNKYYSLAKDIENLIFQITLDVDDTTMNNLETFEDLQKYKNLIFNVDNSSNKIHGINRDIDKVKDDWQILLLASDDMIPKAKGYDEIIRNKMKELYSNTDGVLWFNDGNRKDLNTLPILGKKYYQRFGYIYNPEYKSLWADNEFMTVANILKKQTFIDLVIIHHEHPDWGYGGRDMIHNLNVINENYDKNIFLKRKSKNFDL